MDQPEKVVQPKAAPVSPAKVNEWTFADKNAERINIPGLFEMNRQELNNEWVLKAIALHEAKTGHILFGKVFVKK